MTKEDAAQLLADAPIIARKKGLDTGFNYFVGRQKFPTGRQDRSYEVVAIPKTVHCDEKNLVTSNDCWIITSDSLKGPFSGEQSTVIGCSPEKQWIVFLKKSSDQPIPGVE